MQVTQEAFDCCNVEYYRDENCTIVEHSDFEKKFRHSRNDPFPIASISFGTPRAFVVRRNNSDSYFHITANPLDIILMEGNFQRDYRPYLGTIAFPG